jgi:hypothetical protein
MSEAPLPPVADDELLARFITNEHWIRSDQTVKQDAFIPPKDLRLSVTRHITLSEEALWNVGQRVADQVAEKKPGAWLYGRADLLVSHVSELKLRTEAAPHPNNPNHAHITDWPGEKSKQKSIALELANKADKVILHHRCAE